VAIGYIMERYCANCVTIQRNESQKHEATYILTVQSTVPIKDFGHNWGPCQDIFALAFSFELSEVSKNTNPKPISVVLVISLTLTAHV